MKTSKTAVAVTATPTAQQPDLFAMFQAFMAQQQAPTVTAPVVSAPVSVAPVAKVKSKAPAKGKAKPATPANDLVGIQMLAKSFFVYGDGAPAKLEAFFAKKPHLFRGWKVREIDNVGAITSHWFGGKQLEKIKAELAK